MTRVASLLFAALLVLASGVAKAQDVSITCPADKHLALMEEPAKAADGTLLATQPFDIVGAYCMAGAGDTTYVLNFPGGPRFDNEAAMKEFVTYLSNKGAELQNGKPGS